MYDDVDTFLDMDAPYIYDEPEQYLDTASSSESTSPVMSSFDMTLVNDFNGMDQGIYPSPMSSSRDTASPQPTLDDKAAPAKAPAKRKRENRYKNAPPSVLSRRRAQNRASQRAYRERKDQRIKDLEVMLSEQKQKNDSLSQAYSSLHAEYLKLRGEQARSQQLPRQHTAPPMTYDASTAAHMGMPTHAGTMNFADNMFMFQDMQNYTL
ncbi:AP-1-like transcription factor napA [Colletotrichum spaethianum]|uniref:Putative transcription factor kapC n=1 Tax=Colletotrichum spaethianum TaxID=700344 RepID=A0AA37PDN0_9PEZI|nr:AP-1-like transcription factor napA [Colletotrichum spaethianum]GKT50361.1 AP-1-like transcription factor napA [Colletotrichum spaethianum]